YWKWAKRRPAIASLSASVSALVVLIAVAAPIAILRINSARNSAREEALNAKKNLSAAEFVEAETLLSSGDRRKAVAYLAHAVRVDSNNSVAATRLISALSQYNWPLARSLQHDDELTWAEFSPDGVTAVTSSRDKTARLWNTETSQLI